LPDRIRIPCSVVLLFLAALQLPACSGSSDQAQTPPVSGTIEGGLRVLTFDPVAKDQHFTIYRGDYVRAQLTTGEPFTIRIAALNVNKTFPATEDDKPYFKVPEPGSYRFSVGQGQGTIEAIEYAASAYKEVSSAEAADFITNVNPLILDVRTPREFASGHLQDARLIPLQVFQREVVNLEQHKNEPVFVYCRTGNRSTVAAKILVDNGFTNVVNLRRGIVEWRRAGKPIVKTPK
jgi:rhodanese-related sulfurtransferase